MNPENIWNLKNLRTVTAFEEDGHLVTHCYSCGKKLEVNEYDLASCDDCKIEMKAALDTDIGDEEENVA